MSTRYQLSTDAFTHWYLSYKKYMSIPSEKTLSIVMRGPQVIDEDKFRFEIFLPPIQE
jgi:hypothetical protein